MFESVRVGGRAKGPLILGYFKDQKLDKPTADRLGDAASDILSRPESTGTAGAITEVFTDAHNDRVLLIGLGTKDGFTAGTLRTVAAAAARRLAALKVTAAEIDLDAQLKATKTDRAHAGSAFGEGVGLVAWTCDQFRGSATDLPKRTKLSLRSGDKAFSDGVTRGLGLAEASNLARTLSQTPPNIATTDFMASECKKLARKTGMKCTVLKGDALEREGLQGLINVGKASENAPCLIRLEYTPPRGGARAKPVVLIGKTMTYDSGGLSIKVGGGMKGMKRDKDGGCGVIGAMHAIANVIKPKRKVVALLACAENSISDEAYRPDDVITFRNGVTVEVTNTDAEGRLVLADALCYACDKEDPGCIVDMATLTGGIVVALGGTYAGMWCDDDGLRATLEQAAGASDERVWRMPHHAEYRDMMRSPVADIVNSAPVRAAHPIQGAAFLSYFCPDGVPWAHIDIAGTHAVDKPTGPFDPGPTGFGARLLSEFLDRA
ncbi:MAG: leucyl aminopeptidase family protein [Planctomycetota bacterium]